MLFRSLNQYFLEFVNKKIIFVTGPRQVGKTTLVKNLSSYSFAYYNYDNKKDLKVFKDQDWDISKDLVIFDEIHKMKNWKLWLKGIFDSSDLKKQGIIVTGSARLNILKKVGDSLAGRYFNYSLHPLDLKELKSIEGKKFNLEDSYTKLITISNFPEPYLEDSKSFYAQWRRSHLDVIIRQDLLTLESIRDIDGILLLIELLKTRVGSTISYNSLAEDLNRDDKTVKKWISVLENLYVGFKLPPYSKNIARAKKKAFKFYFYDLGQVELEESYKLENLVALALKKEIDLLAETQGQIGELYFIQTRDGKEIDFYIQFKSNQNYLFEVKLSDNQVSKSFHLLDKYFKQSHKIQLVRNLDREFTNKDQVNVVNALKYLSNLDLKQH
jgi:predicted AAA+ superfamily ATPase